MQVERPDVHVAELVHLAVARQDAGAVGLGLAVLRDDAELDREPEHVGDELHRLVALQPQAGLPGRLGDGGEARAGELFAWPMTSWMMSGSGV